MSGKRNKPKAHYNDDWEDPSLHPDIAPWIQRFSSGGPDDWNYYRCKVCKSSKLTLSNMGITAVKRHMENQVPGKISKHNKAMAAIKITQTMGAYVNAPAAQQTVVPVHAPETSVGSSEVGNPTASTSSSQDLFSSQDQSSSQDHSSSQDQARATSVSFKTKSYETVVAEIYWALDTAKNHTSLNSAGRKGELFRVMFKGHQAAEEFGMSSARLSYIIRYGLAPYFRQSFMSELRPASPGLPPKFVTGFDESENKATYS